MGSVLSPKNPALTLADGRLPMDVLFEVLLRFPVNVLCRLRLVCRSWQSLTSDPIFARAHASRHPLLTSIHFSHSSHEVRVVDLSGNIIKRIPVVQPNVDMTTQLDMVCLTGTILPKSQAGSVLDLATDEAIDALTRDVEQGAGDVISPFFLGHVPSTGEHKVFYFGARAMHAEEGAHAVQVCNVMTLGDSGDGGRWRLTSSPPARIVLHPRERVVIGGVAYFLLSMWCNGNNPAHNVEPDAIAVFDLAAEDWRPAVLQGPLSSHFAAGNNEKKLVYEEYRRDVQLAAMDGCLVTIYHNRQNNSMDLWFLADNETWNKQYSIRPSTDFYTLKASYPLLILDDGRIVIWAELVHVLRVYDPTTNKWDDLATLEKYYVSMNVYQGNLLCLGLQG